MVTSMSSRSRPFLVASGMPRAIACAAINVSNCREPTLCSAIKTLDANSPQHWADGTSNVMVRSLCRSISRASQGVNSARMLAPRVLRMPTVSSAMTMVESNVSLRCANNQSTTRSSGWGFVVSLKTLVSTKIIIFERDDATSKAARGEFDFNAGAGHRDQFVNPVLVGRRRKNGRIYVRRFASANVGPVHRSSSPIRWSHNTPKAA